MTKFYTPFQRETTDEERAQMDAETISLKLNRQERADLEEMKELLDIGGDSQIIKFLVDAGRNVIQGTLSVKQWRYLVSRRRVGYDGRKRRSH